MTGAAACRRDRAGAGRPRRTGQGRDPGSARWRGPAAWRWRRAARRPRPVLAVAVVFGVANGSMQQRLDQAQASSQQIAVVLTAQDAVMTTGPVAGGGTATIVMSHSRHALVFTAQGLHALPASRG